MAPKNGNGRFVYGQFDHGNDFIALAKPPAAKVTCNGGSHHKVTICEGEYTGQVMIIPSHDLGMGLSCKIWKWFKMVGLLTIIGIAFYVGMITLGL